VTSSGNTRVAVPQVQRKRLGYEGCMLPQSGCQYDAGTLHSRRRYMGRFGNSCFRCVYTSEEGHTGREDDDYKCSRCLHLTKCIAWQLHCTGCQVWTYVHRHAGSSCNNANVQTSTLSKFRKFVQRFKRQVGLPTAFFMPFSYRPTCT
jgi:hypothetical protein